jgi:hypothetical protein
MTGEVASLEGAQEIYAAMRAVPFLGVATVVVPVQFPFRRAV